MGLASCACAIFAMLILTANTAEAAARTASVSGDWNNTATWGGLPFPIAGDTVTINSGITGENCRLHVQLPVLQQ